MTTNNTFKSATAHCISIMNEMKDAPMAEVVKAFTTSVVNRKGTPFSVAEARTAYIYLVKNQKAPGVIEKLTVIKAPKAPKVEAPKADRKEALKKAAKKAGIHRDSVATELTSAEVSSDPLGLAAPEKLTLDDLREVL